MQNRSKLPCVRGTTGHESRRLRTGDAAQLAWARPVVERLGDRGFLRRPEEVEAAPGGSALAGCAVPGGASTRRSENEGRLHDLLGSGSTPHELLADSSDLEHEDPLAVCAFAAELCRGRGPRMR
jgi:hypothetical protein